MIGSFVLGASIFLIFDSMYYVTFDVLIENLKVYQPQNPSKGLSERDAKGQKRSGYKWW